MEAVIDKNMLKAKGWAGDASNIFLDGQGKFLIINTQAVGMDS